MDDQFSRTELMIGKENIEKINNSKVVVFGLGGVGSYVVEALARAGIGNFILVDNDIISNSNINRQLIALHSNIGMSKVQVCKNRILDINPNANVEIHQFVGDDNIYIFGESSDEVIEHYAKADYVSRNYYENNANIKEAVDFITSDEMLKVGNQENLERLKNELLNKDWFMTFPDFDQYVETKEKAYADYNNRMEWAKKMLVNIANAGFFSSDRTIEQYNEDIWKLK